MSAFKLSPVAALAATALGVVPGVGAAAQRQGPGPLDEVVVTASASGRPIAADLLGASVNVLAPQDLAQRQVRLVSDVLRDVPGLAVSRTGGVGGATQVRIRGGEGAHTLVLIDNIYAAAPDLGEFDFATLWAEEGARIEVLRGQQPIYGSNAVSGVIHYVTATGAQAPGLSARLEGGGFNTVQGSARYGGVHGPFDLSASAGYFATDGAPNARSGVRELDARNATGGAKLIFAPSPAVRLIAVGRYARTSADTNPTDYASPSAPSFGLPVDGDGFYRNIQRMGLVRGEVDLLDGRWRQGLSVQANATRRRNFDGVGQGASFVNGGRTRYAYDSTLRIDEGDRRHTFTVKIDDDHTRYRNLPTTGAATAANLRRGMRTTGLVGQYDLDWGGRLGLGAAVRRDWNSRFEDVATYRIQGSYRLGGGTRLRAAAGSGVANPTFIELYGFDPATFMGNPDLKPERSKGWEAGIDQTLFGDRLRLSATYFDAVLEDEIFTRFDPATFVSSPGNRSARSTQHGVELWAQAHIGAWRLDAAYTRLDARENGAKEIRRPDDTASLNLAWRSPDDRFGAAASVRYNGRMTDSYFGLTTETKAMPAFTLVNLDADVRLTRRLQVYGRVENAFDAAYEEVYGFVAPGRAAYLGVRASL